MPLLKLQDVHKAYGNSQALRGINLDVERGETVVVIGPSGCGKTTLLRCVCLLDQIDEGSIYLDGRPIVSAEYGRQAQLQTNVNAHRLRVGMVFQHLHVWPHLSVLNNLLLAPRVVRGLNGGEIAKRADMLLQKMGIADKGAQLASTLSGGQQQRVALARALMMEPEILLLDEITSALDPELVGDVLEIIAGLAAEGRTMIVVTHEMLFAAEIATRVVFMDEGVIAESGPQKQLLERPQTERLRRFLARVTRHRIWERKYE